MNDSLIVICTNCVTTFATTFHSNDDDDAITIDNRVRASVWAVAISAPLLALNVIAGTTLNPLLAAAILVTPSLRAQPAHWLVISLGAADWLSAALATPTELAALSASVVGKALGADAVCAAIAAVACGVNAVQLCTLAALGMERFSAVADPFEGVAVRKKRVAAAVAVSWIVGVTLAVAAFWRFPVSFTYAYCVNLDVTDRELMPTCMLLVPLGVVTLTICTSYYVRIVLTVRRHCRQVCSNLNSPNGTQPTRNSNCLLSSCCPLRSCRIKRLMALGCADGRGSAVAPRPGPQPPTAVSQVIVHLEGPCCPTNLLPKDLSVSVIDQESPSMVPVVGPDGTVTLAPKEGNVCGAICVIDPNRRARGRRRVEAESARRAAAVVATFVVLWVPAAVVSVLDMLAEDAEERLAIYKGAAAVTLSMSSLAATANPVAYGLAVRQLRNGCVKMVKMVKGASGLKKSTSSSTDKCKLRCACLS